LSGFCETALQRLWATAIGPFAARAQPATRTLSFLGAITLSTGAPRLAGLAQHLREYGWVKGRNIVIAVA